MPLRIAHIANEPFGLETANGIAQVVYCLARAQAEIGQTVAVFSRDDHAVNVFGDKKGAGSRTSRPADGEPGRSLRQRWLARHVEWPRAEELLTWQPDVVHFHSVHILPNVALAARLVRVGIPYCVTVHGALFPEALRRNRLRKKIFHVAFERRYLNEASFVQALSPPETEAIRRCGVIRPIVEVANGLPPDIPARPSRPEVLYTQNPGLRNRMVFMFVGRLDSWQKGLDLLVDAFANAGLRDAALVLVGPDWRGSRRDLARRAERLGILPRLTFIEPAFGADRANLLAAADVFVHPSRWEGLSLSVLAAAAAGKLCLITREADPLGELERAQAAIIVEASVSSVAEGLKRATALSRQELQVIGARARRVADAHFTWPAIAGKLIDAYRLALNHVHEPFPSKPAPPSRGQR